MPALRQAMKTAIYLYVLTCPVADALSSMALSQASISASAQSSPITLANTPNMGPPQYLLISSPTLGKIVYTPLQNFESTEGRSFALVTSGLESPQGMAFDKNKGQLYIADQAVPAIYKYEILVDQAGEFPSLVTTGLRMTIMKGHPVQWLSLDDEGNLFYTAPDTNDINRIDAEVLAKIGNGEFQGSALQIVDEKTVLAAQAAANASGNLSANSSTALVDTPAVEPRIRQLYEASKNPLVSSPSGIWADGPDLYWTNTKDGLSSGTIVKGQTKPTLVNNPNGSSYFYAEAITKASSGAYNIAKVNDVLFFSQNGTINGTGLVSALLPQTGDVMPIVSELEGPRGLAWDHDQTLYVADEVGGNVWSFPSGRFMRNPPMQHAVTMQGAYGLIMVSQGDPWYASKQVSVMRDSRER